MSNRQQAAGNGQHQQQRPILLYCLLPTVCCLLLSGCEQKMARQPKYRWPDQPSAFFPDGRVSRPIEPDTVARGQLRDDVARFTGQSGPGGPEGAAYVTEIPVPLTMATLKRGQERYNIYCAVCHGRDGYGDGKIVQRGYLKPPSYHDPRLRDMPVGRIYEVVTVGFGAMPSYDEQIPTDDRWYIIAYVRALQLSQNVPAGELTPEERAAVEEAARRRAEAERRRMESAGKAGETNGH
jgi:mono/diheme cytochrome c family protein